MIYTNSDGPKSLAYIHVLSFMEISPAVPEKIFFPYIGMAVKLVIFKSCFFLNFNMKLTFGHGPEMSQLIRAQQ